MVGRKKLGVPPLPHGKIVLEFTGCALTSAPTFLPCIYVNLLTSDELVLNFPLTAVQVLFT